MGNYSTSKLYTRQEYAAICSHCQHRKFDRELGVICGLTDARADFEKECLSYKRDPKVNHSKTKSRVEAAKEEEESKLANKMLGGAVSIIGVLMVVETELTLFGFVAIIYGFYRLIDALSKVPQKKDDLDNLD